MSEAPPPDHAALRALLTDAGDAAHALLGRARVFRKADETRVTDADHAAERLLVAGLHQRFADDSVVGEEGASVRAGPRTWFVDPIDGTHAYLEGLAHWGPTVGRVAPSADGHRPEIGAAYFPRLGEFWFAAQGQGAWRDGQRLPPLQPAALDRHDVLYLPSRFHRWFEVDWPGKVRSLGSTAAHLCLVASGGAVATFVMAGWGTWDVAGGLCLLEEVGGTALTLTGERLDPVVDRSVPFVAGHPDVASALLRRIRFRPRRPLEE
ncbi:MAG: inositol monophosphatase family protein [Alphaproteobacteria bacterium]|nr:inositol monophosphatase family protein [Alphaproteobacteria bacterium]